MKKLFLLLVLNFASFLLFAQEEESHFFERIISSKDDIKDVVEEHRSVVIGAARTTRTADKLPVTVYIIDNQEILRKNCFTLTDVLKSVPGFRISNPGSGEFGEAFIQRGMMGNIYTKILLNGVEVKPSGLTGMTLGANIPIRNAERIEIVYGPASASYGNDACGGVINIVTKNSSEKNFTQVDLGVGIGNDGYSYFNFATGGKFGHGKHVAEFSLYANRLNIKNVPIYSNNNVYDRWNYLSSTLSQSNNGFQTSDGVELPVSKLEEYLLQGKIKVADLIAIKPELYPYTINYNGDILQAKIGDIPQYGSQMGFEIKYRGLKFMYNNFCRRDHATLGLTPMLYNYENASAFHGEFINRFSLVGDWRIGILNTNTSVTFLDYRMDKNANTWANWSVVPQYLYGASDDIILEENLNIKPTKNLEISAGLSYKYSGVLPRTLENENRFDYDSYKMFSKEVDFEYPSWGKFGINPTVYTTYGAYVQFEYDYKIFSFTGGVRYDYNSIWGKSINPRIAGLVQITDNLNFRVSRGYAYKSPALNQSYYSVGVWCKYPALKDTVFAYHHIPGQGLKPEQIASTEFGLRQYLNNKNYMELVVYTNKITNPLIRSWVFLDMETYPGMGSNESRTMTRAYKNVNDAFTRLRGYQFIGVFKDIYHPLQLNIDGGLTLSMGKEKVQDEFARGEDGNPIADKFIEVNSIRQVPRYQAQISFDISFWKFCNLRVENTYCSSWSRKYYLTGESEFDQEPSFYNVDVNFGIRIGRNILFTFKCINLTNAEYGGIDSKEMDVDLPYNVQLRRSFRAALSYNF